MKQIQEFNVHIQAQDLVVIKIIDSYKKAKRSVVQIVLAQMNVEKDRTVMEPLRYVPNQNQKKILRRLVTNIPKSAGTVNACDRFASTPILVLPNARFHFLLNQQKLKEKLNAKLLATTLEFAHPYKLSKTSIRMRETFYRT